MKLLIWGMTIGAVLCLGIVLSQIDGDMYSEKNWRLVGDFLPMGLTLALVAVHLESWRLERGERKAGRENKEAVEKVMGEI